ncbi:hypothetical protein FEM08_16350 [Flavobacterium gilvum]|nr:hypothetical protein FEM08_16350 [Flavobacterium gilvum]
MLLSVLLIFSKSIGQPAPKSPIPVPAPASNLLPGKKAPGVKDIWVVFKTHCDLGYTMSAEEVFKKYREDMMDNAFKLIDADKLKPKEERFKWTIAGWPMYGAILGPMQTPERRARIGEALHEGTFAVHALPASMHTDAFELEDYVRSLWFSSKIARDYKLPLAISAKMTDVPAHSWLLPTLLHHAGVKFLQIGCNYSDRPVLLPQLFWWEGPDGSRILCNYTPHYGSEIVPPTGWPAKNYLAVLMTHDNEGPPSAKEVARVRAEVAKVSGVKLHLGTMDEFTKAVLAENLEIPVIRGDMVDPWIQGVMAMPVETKTARNIRPLESAFEILNTSVKLWGVSAPDISKDLAVAYENSTLFGEHTWGGMTPGWGFFSMDGINRGTERYLYGQDFEKARKEGYYKKFESSFEDHRNYIRKTEAIVNKGIKENLELLAKSIPSDGKSIVVFNPLPWARSGFVELNGEKYFAENVPACGYKTIGDVKSVMKESERKTDFETAFFKVKFDLVKGGITSLIDKSTGKELVEQKGNYVFGQFIHENFSENEVMDYYNRFCLMNNAANATIKPNMPKDAKYGVIVASDWRIKQESSILEDKIILTSTNVSGVAEAVSLTFVFPKNKNYIDVKWDILNKKANTIPEGGWLCFPFKIENPKFIVGRIGGAIDLAKDQIVGGNRHLYGVNTATDMVSPDGTGMGICAIDSPLLSFGEPGLWKYSYDYFPKQASAFVNLYNNMWNTNFPYWTEGSFSNSVRVWTVNKNEKITENIAVNSFETRYPLLAVASEKNNGKLPAEKSGISLSRKGVLVTAFGKDEDGNQGTLLRVWEQAGNSGKLKVTLPKEMKVTKAIAVNLRGERQGKEIKISENQFVIDLNAFAPASFILR